MTALSFRRCSLHTACLIIVAAMALASSKIEVAAFETDEEYVRQVIEEDQQHYGNEYYYGEYQADENIYEKQQQQQRQQREEQLLSEEERLAREQADRLAAERERAFQKELDKMDEDARKKALKQKKRDHRKVQAVLKAANKQDWYGVLGLSNFAIRIPPRSINWAIAGKMRLHLKFPGLTLKGPPTDKDIKRQFRKRARQLHPDKNRDGRAQEAFIMVEHASSILSDPDQRAMYDEELRVRREQQMAAGKKMMNTATRSMWHVSSQVVKTAHMVLGP
ncbi:MAG: hypothetical protein SGARI_002437, partial [Bacillariaceae sp.]